VKFFMLAIIVMSAQISTATESIFSTNDDKLKVLDAIAQHINDNDFNIAGTHHSCEIYSSEETFLSVELSKEFCQPWQYCPSVDLLKIASWSSDEQTTINIEPGKIKFITTIQNPNHEQNSKTEFIVETDASNKKISTIEYKTYKLFNAGTLIEPRFEYKNKPNLSIKCDKN